MDLPGIVIYDDTELEETRVEKWSTDSRPTAVRITGGVGDALIVAQVLAQSNKDAHIFVRDGQVPLIKSIEGVLSVYRSAELNHAGMRRKYGGIFDCPRLFASAKQITDEEYYGRVAKYLSINLPRRGLSNFKVAENKYPRVGKYVCIHAGSSNPNRRLSKTCWKAVAAAWIDQGFHVYWMGTFGDFGLIGKGMSVAWDVSNELVDQMELLRNSKHFYGNDSGFAHIAGILGIKSDVFFTNTHPDQVIARYPNTTGHHAFLPGEVPSRSLHLDDPQGLEVNKRWTPENVCKHLHLQSGSDVEGDVLERTLKVTTRVPPDILKTLKEANYFPQVLDVAKIHPSNAYLDYSDHLFLRIGESVFQVSTNPPDLVRALREIRAKYLESNYS